eukprot:889173_1
MFTIYNATLPSFWDSSIIYSGQNIMTLEDKLYIMLHEGGSAPVLLVYNLINESFVTNYWYNPNLDPNYQSNWNFNFSTVTQNWNDGCMLSDRDFIWFVLGVNSGGSDGGPPGLSYNITTDMWSGFTMATEANRKGIGCIYDNNYAYIFGGKIQSNQRDVDYYELCYVGEYVFECNVEPGTLSYARSYFHISQIRDSHWYIFYGGASQSAKEHIEILNIR